MRKRVTNEEISALCLELSLLLHAGVSLGDALTLLSEEEENPLLSGLAERVDMGAPLSEALRESGAFPAYVSGLVETGERTGRTEQALGALSRYYEERTRMGRRVRSALLYPAVLLGLMLVVIGVLLVKVLPIFDEVYASLGSGLSGAAGGLLALGRWLEGAMPLLWAVLAVLAALAALCAVWEPARSGLPGLWRRLSGDRGVTRKLDDARLAQALAMAWRAACPWRRRWSWRPACWRAGRRPAAGTVRAGWPRARAWGPPWARAACCPPGAAGCWSWASGAAQATRPWSGSPRT